MPKPLRQTWPKPKPEHTAINGSIQTKQTINNNQTLAKANARNVAQKIWTCNTYTVHQIMLNDSNTS